MTNEKNLVKNEASANDKHITINDNWQIDKSNTTDYMISNTNVFIHGNKISINTKNTENVWLNIYHNDSYIGSIWIDSEHYIKEVKKFIKETRVIQ